MNITTSRFQPRSLSAPRPSKETAESVTLSSRNEDTFTTVARTTVGTGIGAAVGYGLGSAAAMGGFGGGTVGAITGLATGMFITSSLGNGKGAEGIIYPIAGAAIGGIGGAILGAIGGDHVAWVGAAAGGLALLQIMRD